MATDMNKLIVVTNRSDGMVLYEVPDLGTKREFNCKETKQIPYKELVSLAQQPGGRELIYNFLLVQDAAALESALNVEEQPEYWLTEEKIPSWMNSCSLSEFQDALDFAPEGVKELIKKYAISMPLNAADKRAAIKEQLQFDIDKAIENAKDDAVAAAAPTPKVVRRSQPKYNVVSKAE